MARKEKKEEVTPSELQKQIKALVKRLNRMDADLDAFDRLTVEMNGEIQEARASKEVKDLLEKIDVVESIYGEANASANSRRGPKRKASTIKDYEKVDVRLRRILVRKGIIDSGDISYEYLKEEFRPKK